MHLSGSYNWVWTMHSRWQLGSNWGGNLDPSKMLFTRVHLGETKWQLRYFQGWTNNAFNVATWLWLKANKKRCILSGNFGSSNSLAKSYRPIAIEIFSRYTQCSPNLMCKWQKSWEKVHNSFRSDQKFIGELLFIENIIRKIHNYMILLLEKVHNSFPSDQHVIDE